MPTLPRDIDVARHDAEHRLAGADDAGAVGADDGGALVLRIAPQVALDAHHVLRGNAVGDDADQPQARIGRFHQRIGRVRRRHEGEAGLGAGGVHRILHRVEYRAAEVCLPALARRDAAHHPRAVGDHLLGVKGRLVAGEALHNHRCRFIDQNAHCLATAAPRDAATALRAASARVSAVMMGRPHSRDDAPALLDIGAGEPHHQRHLQTLRPPAPRLAQPNRSD